MTATANHALRQTAPHLNGTHSFPHYMALDRAPRLLNMESLRLIFVKRKITQ
jgi:hypothetical protein